MPSGFDGFDGPYNIGTGMSSWGDLEIKIADFQGDLCFGFRANYNYSVGPDPERLCAHVAGRIWIDGNNYSLSGRLQYERDTWMLVGESNYRSKPGPTDHPLHISLNVVKVGTPSSRRIKAAVFNAAEAYVMTAMATIEQKHANTIREFAVKQSKAYYTKQIEDLKVSIADARTQLRQAKKDLLRVSRMDPSLPIPLRGKSQAANKLGLPIRVMRASRRRPDDFTGTFVEEKN